MKLIIPRQNRVMEGLIPGSCKIRKRGCSSSSSSVLQNYQFKRAILVGKPPGSRSSTPVPSWRTTAAALDSRKYVPSQSGGGRSRPVSARKLAATLWEMNEVPSSRVGDNLEEKKAFKREMRVRERMVVPRSVHSGSLPPHLSDPSHSPVSKCMGRHARRNESLLLDPLCGKLETISVQRAPAPRMGHTSSMVGIVFPPRHRHAAAVIDSKIYVFGGLNGEIISSALHILDTSSLEWNEIQVQGEWPCPRHSHWVLQLEKKYAKLGKDILKKFGWLDLGRKVYSKENGIHICFPVTQKFCTTYRDKQNHPGGALEVLDDINPFKAFSGEGVLSKDFTFLTSLNLLMASGATILADEVVKVKKISRSPLKVTSEAVANLLKHKGLPTELLDQLPTRFVWERLGDIIVLPMTSFKDPAWDSVGAELWPIVAKSLGAQRLARQSAELLQLELGTVLWRFLWEIMAGLTIGKMEFSIPLIQPSACSPGEIFLRSLGWPVLTVEMKLLWIYLQASDILCCHSLSGPMQNWFMPVNGIPMPLRHSDITYVLILFWIAASYLKEITELQRLNCDKSAEVRKAAEVCIGEIFRVCGPDAVTKNLKDIQGPALAIVLERLKHSEAFQEAFEVAKTISMGPSLKSRSKVGKSGSKCVNEAVSSGPDNDNTRHIIYVKQGIYNESVVIGSNKKNVMFVGDGMDLNIITGNLNVIDGSTTFNSVAVGF
ncbi:unnamed protein product [Camellia sinensis]